MAKRALALGLLLLCITALPSVRADPDNNDGEREQESDFRGKDAFPDFADCTQEAPADKYVGVIYGIGRYARGVDTVGSYPGLKNYGGNPTFAALVDAYVSVFADGPINITLAGVIFTDKAAINASTVARAGNFYVRRHAFTAHQMWQCPGGDVFVIFSGTIMNGAVTSGVKQAGQLQLQKYTQLWTKQGDLWKVKYSLPVDEFPTSRGTMRWTTVAL